MAEGLTPNERVLRSRVAAHTRWAKEVDRTAATAAARQKFQDRFEREVDPDRVMDPTARAKAADSARKAYYTSLQLKSAQARRRRKAS